MRFPVIGFLDQLEDVTPHAPIHTLEHFSELSTLAGRFAPRRETATNGGSTRGSIRFAC